MMLCFESLQSDQDPYSAPKSPNAICRKLVFTERYRDTAVSLLLFASYTLLYLKLCLSSSSSPSPSIQGCVFTGHPESAHRVSRVAVAAQRQWRFGLDLQQHTAVLHQLTAMAESPPSHPGSAPHRQPQPGPCSLW